MYSSVELFFLTWKPGGGLYKDGQGITARHGKSGVADEKLYWQWIQSNFPDKLSSWQMFDNAKVVDRRSRMSGEIIVTSVSVGGQ